MNPIRRHLITLLGGLGLGTMVQAQGVEVTLAGTFPGRAVLVINRDAPRSVAVGDSYYGVKVVSVGKDTATVEMDGKQRVLLLGRGNSPGRRYGSDDDAGDQRAVLIPSGNGHFSAPGAINGRGVMFLLDTGASLVVIPANVARNIGINMAKATPSAAITAGGTVRSWNVVLENVRVGDISLNGVDASVVEADMGGKVLLGNSFLARVRITQEGRRSVLTRLY